MKPEDLAAAARQEALDVLGLCHTLPSDELGSGTIVLLGPAEPGFWAHATATPEFKDGSPDPLDRWSHRVISTLAHASGGKALFPFGTPARPFISWALRSGRTWTSPVGLLVHDSAGLLVSFRGAILLDERLPLPPPTARPCETCETKPCLNTCPVGALTDQGYDIPACRSYLDGPDEAACKATGCAVRRSCPVSQTYPRDPAQSAFHMASFHPAPRE